MPRKSLSNAKENLLQNNMEAYLKIKSHSRKIKKLTLTTIAKLYSLIGKNYIVNNANLEYNCARCNT